MGGFSAPVKITGHSGTDFRHRKAFERRRALKKKASHRHSEINGSEPKKKWNIPLDAERHFQNSPLAQKIVFNVKIILLIAVSGIGAFFFLQRENYFSVIAPSTYPGVVPPKVLAEENAYQVLTKTADSYRLANALNAAQNEYTRALKVNPTGFQAQLGLTQTLMQHCEQNDKYCTSAKAYLTYLERAYGISEESLRNELKRLE